MYSIYKLIVFIYCVNAFNVKQLSKNDISLTLTELLSFHAKCGILKCIMRFGFARFTRGYLQFNTTNHAPIHLKQL